MRDDLVGAAGDQEGTPQPPSRRARATQIDRRLVAALGIFRHEPGTADTLDPDVARVLEAASFLGTNSQLARRATESHDGRGYFLVAGTDSVALVNDAGVGAIDDIEHALTGQCLGVQDFAGPAGDQLRLIGLMPDSAKNVEVVVADGTRSPLIVRGNVYVRDFAKTPATLPVSVQYDIDGRRQTANVPVPADILSGHRATPP